MEVGRILKRLDDEGIADNTFVFFITDHGISHARGKQFLYDEGIHIPFVVRGPGGKCLCRKRVISARKCRVVFFPSRIEWLRLGYTIIANGLLCLINSFTSASVP